MITQPLTSNEEEILRQNIKAIENGYKCKIRIDETNQEVWLNIFKMAERANELVTKQWRKSPKSNITF